MSPDPHPSETSTLAALGHAPPLPPEASAAQRANVQEVQTTAALTWLAMTDLQPAPASIWQGVHAAITPASVAATLPQRPSRSWPITYSGWAAAAALALGWWSQNPAPPPPSTATLSPPPFLSRQPAPSPPSASASNAPSDENLTLRAELELLRQRLASAAATDAPPGVHRPAILELRAPHQTSPTRSPRESAARLQQLVTHALQRDLILQAGNDPSAIVLERGWPTAPWIPSDSGQTIRHLNFPADRWEELGLWKAPDVFYDPASLLTWSPAPDGLGYLGRVTASAPDPAGFALPRPKQEQPAPLAEIKTENAPAGYLVSDPNSTDATLLLTDLPPVPEGGSHVIVASNDAGQTTQYQVSSERTDWIHGDASTPSSLGSVSNSFSSSSVDSMTLSSLNLSGHFTQFNVLEFAPGRSIPRVILTSSGE